MAGLTLNEAQSETRRSIGATKNGGHLAEQSQECCKSAGCKKASSNFPRREGDPLVCHEQLRSKLLGIQDANLHPVNKELKAF